MINHRLADDIDGPGTPEEVIPSSSHDVDFAMLGSGHDGGPSKTLLAQAKETPAKAEHRESASPARYSDSAMAEELLREQFAELVYRYIYSRVADAHVADELTGDVFVLAGRRLQRGGAFGDDPGALLMRLARQAANKHEGTIRLAVMGTSGAGKSVLVKQLVAQTLRREAETGDEFPADTVDSRCAYPDPERSRAVLIGASSYGNAPPLYGVEPAVAKLAEVFGDVGVPQAVTLSGSAATRDAVIEAVRTAAAEAADTLVVHLACHGATDRGGHFVVGTADADPSDPDSGLRFLDVHDLVRHTSAPRTMIVIDACFAGHAGRELESIEPSSIPSDVNGGREEYVLAATGPDGWALDRNTQTPDVPYPAFTGALMQVLTDGVPDAPMDLDIPTVFGALDRRLTRATMPRPYLYARGFRRHSLALGPNPHVHALRPSYRHAGEHEGDDYRFLCEAAAGDHEAWDRLVERYARLVWSVARSMHLTGEEARDVSQTTWLRLLEKVDDVRTNYRLGPWLSAVARAEGVRILRQRHS